MPRGSGFNSTPRLSRAAYEAAAISRWEERGKLRVLVGRRRCCCIECRSQSSVPTGVAFDSCMLLEFIPGFSCRVETRPTTQTAYARRATKKDRRSAPHSSASTPPSLWSRWFNASCRTTLKTLPAAPARGSVAANTRRFTRACTIAPAHIAQGSSVTYKVVSSRR